MDRAAMIGRLADPSERWDVLVIGGGATGLGAAVDAAARGYRTALVEQADFGKGTSSRSTKLVHGGVRYLRQGRLRLVTEALAERDRLRKLAPHLVSELRFVVPCYAWWEAPYYGVGMRAYDVLAGHHGFGRSRRLSADEAIAALPTVRSEGLRGGVEYADGLFDDARLLVNLARTATDRGAAVANYARVERLLKGPEGRVEGAEVRELEGGQTLQVRAKAVINATGPFTDAMRRADDAGAGPIMAPSRGTHLVLPRRFLPGEAALMVPKTRDGRVIFAIPWHDRVVLGTTDVPVGDVPLEPMPTREEADWLLDAASGYLEHPAGRGDVRSSFAGIRPLVGGGGKTTASLSRDHHIEVSGSGLVTIAGGKWTTYRRMAEDAVDRAAAVGGLPRRPCPTRDLPIHGHRETPEADGPLAVYGSDAESIRELSRSEPGLTRPLHPDLSIVAAEVVWAARREMARRVEDVLCRRTRSAILDAGAASAIAPEVASVLASELGRDGDWASEEVADFRRLCRGYLDDVR